MPGIEEGSSGFGAFTSDNKAGNTPARPKVEPVVSALHVAEVGKSNFNVAGDLIRKKSPLHTHF